MIATCCSRGKERLATQGRQLINQGTSLIRVSVDAYPLVLACAVEHVVKEDGLLLDLVQLLSRLRVVVGLLVRLLGGYALSALDQGRPIMSNRKWTDRSRQVLHELLGSHEVPGRASSDELLQFLGKDASHQSMPAACKKQKQKQKLTADLAWRSSSSSS